MQIKVNGEMKTLQVPMNVAALVEQFGLNTKQVAIERNRQIVPRSRWNEEAVAEGDEIEIVKFIGGG